MHYNRRLKASSKGGPLAEYMPLLAGIAIVAIVAVNLVGITVTDVFDTVAEEIGFPGGTSPGGSGPGGSDALGVPGAVVSPSGGFCPPAGWSYRSGQDYYWVTGVVTQRPVLEVFDSVTTEWDPPSLPEPALGAGYMDKMYIESEHEQLHWPEHIYPILIGWHAFTDRYVVPASLPTPAADCPPGNDGSGGVGTSGPTPPSGAGGVLMGTPGPDTLNLNGIDDEVVGLEDNDVMQGWQSGSVDEIFNGGPGDDEMHGEGGSDTYYFSPGHGSDYVMDFTGSSDSFFFDGIMSLQVEITANGNDLVIKTGSGDSINWAGPLRSTNASIYMIESMIFEDRTLSGKELIQMGVQQSVDDAQSGDVLMSTVYDDKWIIRSDTPSVDIYDNLSNNDTLVFPDFDLDDVTFAYAGGGIYQPSVRINLPNGNDVFINRHAQFGSRSVERIVFRDQVVTQEEFSRKYISDQSETGYIMGLSGDDTYVWRPGDTPFEIEERSGNDVFDLTATNFSEWTFSSDNARYSQESLLMEHSSGVRLIINEAYTSPANQVETFQFNDQAVTWAQMEVIAPR